MQFTSIFTLLAVAMTAAALPSGDMVAARGGGGGETNICSSQTANVCCNGLALNCVLTGVLGQTCQGSSYCCANTTPQVSSH